jgi:hypothetical protein
MSRDLIMIEQPHGEVGGQVGIKAQTAFAGLLPERSGFSPSYSRR